MITTSQGSRSIMILALFGMILTACSSSELATISPTEAVPFPVVTFTVLSATMFPTPTETFVPTPIPTIVIVTETSEYIATLPIASVNQTDQKEIARRLFTQWLDHYKTEGELDDYELIEVGLEDLVRENMEFVASVMYSVKPSAHARWGWDAGNGVISEDRTWIRNKFLFIGVRKDNNVFRLILIGTGP